MRVTAKYREKMPQWTSHTIRWDPELVSEPKQPPEAELLERLRTDARPKLSVRAAADAAGISDARWRQIAKGFKYEAGGIRVPARAPDDTLARMAHVVGATPAQLREADREDAAIELERLLQEQSARSGQIVWEHLTDADKAAIRDETAHWNSGVPLETLVPNPVFRAYGMVPYDAILEIALRLERASNELPENLSAEFAANIDAASDLADRVAAAAIGSATLVRQMRRQLAAVMGDRDQEVARDYQRALAAARNHSAARREQAEDLAGPPSGPDRWPDGQPVYDEDWEQWKAWRAAGEPEDWELYRSGKQSDVEAVGGPGSYRIVPEPTDKERFDAAQDADAETPDPAAPDDRIPPM